MPLRQAIAAGAIALAAVLLPSAAALAASDATVSGTINSGTAKLPRSAKAAEAQVLAMNIDTGAYGDAAHVGKSGRYELKLPAGKWALRSSVLQLGRPFVSFLSAGIVTKAGQRRSLPLTLKKFKKPRKGKKAKRKARAANINPRDGREYPGEAYGVPRFSVVGGDAEIAQLGRGTMEMLITDLMTKKCPFTVVEVDKRPEILKELAFQQSEYVDPASAVEPGHLIDPEILIRGRVEDRPGTPHRLALIAWLEDAKTGARLSGDVSSVTLATDYFQSEERLAMLIQRDLICARADAAPAPVAAPGPVAAPAPVATPKPPPPSPPLPPGAPDTYTGTFSGEAESVNTASMRWTWNGTVKLDAADDDSSGLFIPNGAPPGSYRLFTVTSGSVDLSVVMDTGSCVFRGSGRFDVLSGLTNTLKVQLDVPNPAYELRISGLPFLTVDTTKTGAGCPSAPSPLPIYAVWATTGTFAHTSSSMTLVDSQAELTPETPFDYDSTTRWNLAPG